MKLFCKKNRGAISVFLTLILVPVLVFSGIIVDASRLYASKTVISGAGELAMNAALAQYDKKLKDNYGLIAMADAPDSPKVAEKLKQYFLESCNASFLEGENAKDLHSMIQLELGDNGIQARGVEGSSLADTTVLQQQILEYMKYRGPVYMVNDIIEKFRKLPLEKMSEKQEYVEKKTDYGKAVSKLGSPLKEAKKYLDIHIEATDHTRKNGNGDINEIISEYRKQSVFWLASRSIEGYLRDEYLLPVGEGEMSQETFRNNLQGSVVWDSGCTDFDYSIYTSMLAAVALYQYRSGLEPGVTEENGFSQEEIRAFQNIESNMKKSIKIMDSIHNSSIKSYRGSLKLYESEVKAIIDSGNKAIDALNDVINVWEKKVIKKKQYYEDAKTQLLEAGEDVSEIEAEEENNQIEINVEDVRKLISCIEDNIQAAQYFQEELSKLKVIPSAVENTRPENSQIDYIRYFGETDAIDLYWYEEEIYDCIPDSLSINFLDSSQQKFYQDCLKEIELEPDKNEEQDKRKEENKKEAQDSQEVYQNAVKKIEAESEEKNLNEYDGSCKYPDDFPSALAGTASDIAESRQRPEINVDDEEQTIDGSIGFFSDLQSLLDGLNVLSGEVLERAYLMEYMTEMFNCLTTGEGEKSLSGDDLASHYITNGEMEYILYGNPNTAMNKIFAVGEIYGIRLAINSIYVFLDKDMNVEANAIATSLSTAIGQPWLYSIVKCGYLFCRAIIISGKDIGQLVQGKDVAIWPGDNDKNLTLNYKEYIKLFILISILGENGEKKLLSRTGDCIQFNTGKELSNKYTMIILEAEVKSTTIFLPKVPVFLGRDEQESDGKKVIRYKGVMAY